MSGAVTHTDALGYASPRKWVTADRAEQIRVMSADRAERIRGRTVAGPPKHAAPDSPRTPRPRRPSPRPSRRRCARAQRARCSRCRRARHSAFTHSPPTACSSAARRAEVVSPTTRARCSRASRRCSRSKSRGAARGLYVREVQRLDPRTVGSRVEVTLRPHVTVEEALTLGDVRLEDGHDRAAAAAAGCPRGRSRCSPCSSTAATSAARPTRSRHDPPRVRAGGVLCSRRLEGGGARGGGGERHAHPAIARPLRQRRQSGAVAKRPAVHAARCVWRTRRRTSRRVAWRRRAPTPPPPVRSTSACVISATAATPSGIWHRRRLVSGRAMRAAPR